VPDGDGAVTEAVPNLACRLFGLPADVLCALSDGLSHVTHGATEIARGWGHPFFRAKKRRLEGHEPQQEEEARAHGRNPTWAKPDCESPFRLDWLPVSLPNEWPKRHLTRNSDADSPRDLPWESTTNNL
jgi:hypothetical protein